MSEPYRVRLDAFEGPMDLLLFLIRKHEVDLHDIPVAPITEQYLAYMGEIESIDIELAGEFLVMAATLMELKSRLLAQETLRGDGGEDSAPEHEPGDPRAELVQQLLEYKKYRDAADALEARRADWSRRSPVRVQSVDSSLVRNALEEMGELELEELDLSDLVEAFHGIIESVNFDRLGDHEVLSDDTPIEEHAHALVAAIADRPAGAPPLTLREAVRGRTKRELVGIFLALLVLVRDQRVRFEAVGGEIELSPGEAGEPAEDGPVADFV